MPSIRTSAALLIAAVALATLPHGPAAPPNSFALFVEDYYAAQFAADPVQATYAGVHDYDAKLADLSANAVARRIAELKQFQTRLGTLVSKSPLNPADALDATVLHHAIQAELLDLEGVQDWKRNPVGYLGKPAESIDLLMKRTYAPKPERLKSIVGRLNATPALLDAMQANVKTPPKEFADLGLIVAKGSVEFFKTDLPAWAKTTGADANLLAEFEAANTKVITAFEAATKWVETELLPNTTGRYAIGQEAFLAKLEAEEMLDIPLDRLLAIGEANLRKDQQAFKATAKLIDPSKSPADVLKLLTQDRPAPDDLVAATRGTLERTRQFLIANNIVSIPSEVRPTVAETPAFARTGGFASMDTPGAYETKATEAFYYVTPPETDWPAERKAEHMCQFNRTALDVITIHEAYPGHYLQFLNAKQYPTKVRKLYTCGTNVEGWAHYTEQMCLDEGYGDGDPKMRLAQFSEALLRDCRYIVGIKLHTAGWTVEQGKQFFVEQGYIEPEAAFQESRRGTYNPTYLYYTLGKLQILKLREDCKKARGAKFNLKAFHDEFVRQGGVPIKLIRGILLPGDTGPTL